MNRIFLLLIAICMASCAQEQPTDVGTVDGMKPVYISEAENTVEVLGARPFGTLGKIVYSNPYLLINERFQGIHLVDNSNPANPIKVQFIKIPGNTDFTVKDGFLYANHGSDFKVFQIELDPEALGLMDFNLLETCVIDDFFLEGQSNNAEGLFPPNYSGFFECVDPEKGIVINWEEDILVNPECRI